MNPCLNLVLSDFPGNAVADAVAVPREIGN